MGHLHHPNLNDYVLDIICIWLLIHKTLKLGDLFGQACPAATPNQISGYPTAKEILNDIYWEAGLLTKKVLSQKQHVMPR